VNFLGLILKRNGFLGGEWKRVLIPNSAYFRVPIEASCLLSMCYAKLDGTHI
jgi:hypothetical protein